MTTLVKDTHQLIKVLQNRGYTKDQAEGFVDVIQELDTSQIVSKHDLENALSKTKFDIIKWVFGLMLAQTALLITIINILIKPSL